MDLFNFIATYVWPVIVGYLAWLHKELHDLRVKLGGMEVDVAKNYAPKNDLSILEARLVGMLDRIDDKVTRILEGRHNG
jgi:hypothetical protein